jgi:hypothetical protein
MLKGEERQQTKKKNGIFSAHGNVQFFFLSTKYWLALAGGDRMDVAINNQIPGGALITQRLFLKVVHCTDQYFAKKWHYFEKLLCTSTSSF